MIIHGFPGDHLEVTIRAHDTGTMALTFDAHAKGTISLFFADRDALADAVAQIAVALDTADDVPPVVTGHKK